MLLKPGESHLFIWSFGNWERHKEDKAEAEADKTGTNHDTAQELAATAGIAISSQSSCRDIGLNLLCHF